MELVASSSARKLFLPTPISETIWSHRQKHFLDKLIKKPFTHPSEVGAVLTEDMIRGEPEVSTSVFQSDLPVREKLEKARTELLDLSARNRLLNMPRGAKGAKSVAVVDERTTEVFRMLAREGRPFTFVPGKTAPSSADGPEGTEGTPEDDSEEIAELAQPEDDEIDERGMSARHTDTRLQTRLTPAGLQKRLLELYYDAKTLEEEQGVNILYLALGALKWIDPKNAANIRYAPLVLVPVFLDRGNAVEKFKLRPRPEEFASNLSLEALLDQVHGIKLPTFEASDAFDPAAYFDEVADAVSAKPGWEVLPDDIVLGFFSFAKFLMYRDLDPDTWPAGRSLIDRELVLGLLRDGFDATSDMIPEDANIDQHIAPADMLHIVDSDSSQALAVHEVRRGRDMVIQGPPGTGKSQTIANIVASAVADGKRVLFVAEKMAALEVVKRRLDATGVGDACLELHSNKANKRAVLDELRRTWELGAPRGAPPGTLHARLEEARDRLNGHAQRMHSAHPVAEVTPYQVVGQLSRLKLEGEQPNDIKLEQPETWTRDGFNERHGVLSELVERVTAIGTPSEHPWLGVMLSSILPTDVERLTKRFSEITERIDAHVADGLGLSAVLETSPPATLAGLDTLGRLADRVASAPDIDPKALASDDWRDNREAISQLLAVGNEHAAIVLRLGDGIRPQAWDVNLTGSADTLAALPAAIDGDAFARLAQLEDLLPRLVRETDGLAASVGREPPRTLQAIQQLAIVAERVSAAPEASPEAFAANLWDGGVERAADLASAVAELEKARNRIGDGLTDSAWEIDLTQARTTLAAHGTGFFRIFSGEWRQANRTVRSVLSNPATPLDETLALLDAVAKGRKALSAFEAEREFGASAFGLDWRGDRSVSEPLLALVEWMRSLRGLGAEPRLIASKRPDRGDVGSRAERVRQLAETAATSLSGAWTDFGSDVLAPQDAAVTAIDADITSVLAVAELIGTAERTTRAILAEIPDRLQDRRTMIASVIAGQAAAEAVAAGADLGGGAFGALWNGTCSDWPMLAAVRDWIAANDDIRLLASRIGNRAAVARSAGKAIERRDALTCDLASTLDGLKLDRQASLGGTDLGLLDIEVLRTRTAGWSTSGEKLFQWVAYRDRSERGTALGCGDVVARLSDGRLTPEQVVPAFEMAYYEAIYSDIVAKEPDLGTFDGVLHGRLARDFAEMDLQRIAAASYEVVRVHHQAVPPRDGGAVGPLGVLRSEMARKRGHMPIRKLMEKAAPAIQALKPVFMMSPLSVAQFLAPGVFDFDLLVMDEASQIQPVDAMGAVARAKQVVVVGDPKQLPPTAFFSKMTGGGDEDDDSGRVGDIESILGLFTARGLPMRMLRWHYRSKHQSLIAVSNRQFYENKLFIVPSPYTAEAGMGLRFHHISDGLFDAGGTRTNQVEARIVAQAIIAHAKANPNLSLGVAAFSAAQRRAIVDQLELLRRTISPEVEAFFQNHPSEPFFVKNLENVQGDERDVMFISVGYGPTVPGGRVPMRFGPLGTEGGERRLNVLISRAKQRCEVFASMTDEDIDPDFAQTRKGVFAFRLFLHFARTGRMTMAESTGRHHDSVFEEQVARALQNRGYLVHRQVGLAGFYIDLAIADEAHPGRYLLGIECDGASYHGARSARDRDRLRQSVLESHGWTIHRVWSTDWFQRPGQELDRIIERIEAAKDEAAAGPKAHRAVPYEIVTVDRHDATEIGIVEAEANPAVAYVEAAPARPPHLICELHEAPRGTLSAMVEEVVQIEGPVHLDEVVARVRGAWGLKRAGGRIQEAVASAADVSLRLGRLERDGNFLNVPGRVPQVRDRSDVASSTLRKPELIPPAEIERAIMDVVGANYGATNEQVVLSAARAIGFKATSSQLRDVIAAVVEKAVKRNWLSRRDGLLITGTDAPAPPRRTLPPSPLASLIAEGEHERLEFKETMRWDVVLGEPNKKIEDIVIKTVAGLSNRLGGTLLVGVADDGSVKGLDRDYGCLGGNRDKLELHLTNLLGKHFGQSQRASRIKVSFPPHDGHEVCRIDVERAPDPTFVSIADRGGNATERFYVRSGNSTQELTPSETARYIREHFG